MTDTPPSWSWCLLGPAAQTALRCDSCFGYPSVGPVVVTAGRRTLCGRCAPADGDDDHGDGDPDDVFRFNDNFDSDDDEGDDRKVAVCDAAKRRGAQGPVVAPSRANALLEAALFPCANHYEGCEAVLAFGEAARHEKDCTLGKEHVCPFCDYLASSGSQLVGHCARRHPAFLLGPGGVIKLPPPERRRVLLRADGLRLATAELETDGAERVLVRVRSLAEPRARPRPYRVSFCGGDGRVVSFPVDWKPNARDNRWSAFVEVDLGLHFPGEPLDALSYGIDVGVGDDCEWWQHNMRGYLQRSLDVFKDKDEQLEEMRNSCKAKDELIKSLQLELESRTNGETNCKQIPCDTKYDDVRKLRADLLALENKLESMERLLPERCDAGMQKRYFSLGNKACRCVKCGTSVKSGPIFFGSEDLVFCPECVFYAPVECLDSPYTCPCGDVFPIRKYHQHASCPSDRRYKCVVGGCDWFLPLNELRKHWHAAEQLNIGNIITFQDDQKEQNIAFYWNIDEELIFCRFVYDKPSLSVSLFIKEVDTLPRFNKKIQLNFQDVINSLYVGNVNKSIVCDKTLGYCSYRSGNNLCNFSLTIVL